MLFKFTQSPRKKVSSELPTDNAAGVGDFTGERFTGSAPTGFRVDHPAIGARSAKTTAHPREQITGQEHTFEQHLGGMT
ncbi:hypothetical protein [Streptomyces sp. GC420]|uniref:hypothetical protein n=1 Tax=Streptomyces sp. GC420 TaxID=2697568 RepID=UPI0014152CA4|nr:hypothetical protein [Streptomyces sp. GC420]NBM19246.1 hypothetical protein [Streptomyces sp. GC420]